MDFIEKSVQKCPGEWGLIFFIVNICLPGIGTIGSGFCASNGANCNAFIVGILQLCTVPLFLIGWFWSIWWGWRIYSVSK